MATDNLLQRNSQFIETATTTGSILRADVYSAHIPSAADWLKFSSNIDYLKGQGQTLIPACLMNNTITGATGTPNEYHWTLNIFPGSGSLARCWNLSLFGSGQFYSTIVVGISSSRGKTQNVSQTFFGNQNIAFKSINFIQHLTQSTANYNAETVSLTVSVLKNSATIETIKLISVECWDVPRPYLESATTFDNVIDPTQFQARNAIFAQNPPNPHKGTSGLLNQLSQSIWETRQAGIFHWSHPVSTKIAGTNKINISAQVPSSSTTSNLTLFTLPVKANASRIYANEDTGSIWTYLYGYNSGSTTDGPTFCGMEVTETQISNVKFMSMSVPINSYFTLSASVNVKCHGSGGNYLPIGATKADEMNVIVFRGAGTGSGRIYVYDINIGELRL